MKTSQMKTLALLILVAVNAFLLAQIIPREVSKNREKKEITDSLVELCASHGITMDAGDVPADGLPARMTAERSVEREQAAAAAILGKVTRRELGGGINSYSSEMGEAVFRGGGDFSVEVPYGGGDRQPEDAAGLFADMGFDFDPETISSEEREGKVHVSAVQRIGELSVFDCTATAVYGAEGLESVYGRWITQTQESPVTNEDLMDVSTVIVYFLDRCSVYGIVCGSIDRISTGYYSGRSAGAVTLRTCWQIATDTGIYFIDAADRSMMTTF